MKFFKRIEVWILLLLVIGGLIYVLVTSLSPKRGSYNADDAEAESAAAKNANPGEKLDIRQVRLERDFRNYKTSITFSYDNSDGKEPLNRIEDVQLKDSAGQSIPIYWLASMPPLEPIPVGEASEVTNLYWLEEIHLQGELWLHVNDARLRIKSNTPMPTNKIPEGGSHVFEKSDWSK